MRRLAFLATVGLLAACGRHEQTALPSTELDQAIATAVGDPSTCVLIAERATGKIRYRYGQLFNCVRGLPACDRPGYLNARSALKLAAIPPRGQSCASTPTDTSRQVGWAEGVIGGPSGQYIYSAVMEGDRALPGEEMHARLFDVWTRTGLAR